MPYFTDTSGVTWELTLAAQPPTLPPPPTPSPAPTGRVRVSGLGLVTATGTPWVGRGLNLMDTSGCWACINQAPNVAEVIRRLEYFDSHGANFFRLCVESHPGTTAAFNQAHLNDIETIVATAHERGIQVLVSLWHDDTFDADWLPTPATYVRLRELAVRLEKHPNAWIGCCNEPTMNFHGGDNARRFGIMQACVDAIRGEGFTGVIAVQGLAGWARDMSYYLDHRIADDNVLYETHVYGHPPDYDTQVAVPRSRGLPVFMGEYGKVDNYMTADEAVAVLGRALADGVTTAAWVGHHRCGLDSATLVDNSNGGCGIGMPLALTPWGAALVAGWSR